MVNDAASGQIRSIWGECAHLTFKRPSHTRAGARVWEGPLVPWCAVSAFGRNGLFPLAAFFTWTRGTVFYLTALEVAFVAEIFQLPASLRKLIRFQAAFELLAPHLDHRLPCLGNGIFRSPARGVSLAVEQVLYTDKVGGSIPSLRTALSVD